MKKMISATALVVAALASQTASAACSCICVNNNKQWACANSWDVPAGYCGGFCTGNSEVPKLEVPDQASIKLLESISQKGAQTKGSS